MSDEPTKAIVLRDAHGRLMPGTKMLPGGGKPKSIARIGREVLERYGGPSKLFEFLYSVAVGDLSVNARMNDRLKAAELYLDRSYGKPEAKVTIAEETVRAAIDTASMDDDELLAAREHLAAIKGIVERVGRNAPVDAELVEP